MTQHEQQLRERFDRILAQHGDALGSLASVSAGDAEGRDGLLQEILIAVWRARLQIEERTP